MLNNSAENLQAMQIIMDTQDKRINNKLKKTDGSGGSTCRDGTIVQVNDDNTANVLLTGANSPITNVPNRSCYDLYVGEKVYIELINGNLSNCVIKYAMGTDKYSNRIGYKGCYIDIEDGLNCTRDDGAKIYMNNNVGLEVDNASGTKVAGLTLDGAFVSTRLGTPGASEDQFFAVCGNNKRPADGYGFFLYNKGIGSSPFFKIWSSSDNDSVIEYSGKLVFKSGTSNLFPLYISDDGLHIQNNVGQHSIGIASTGELETDGHPTINQSVTVTDISTSSNVTLNFVNGWLASNTSAPIDITRAIDISGWNTVTDWSTVKNNTDAVYIKATEGTTYTDSTCGTYANGASGVGLKYSFYHYFWPHDTTDAIAQAQYFYNAIKNYSYNCIPAIDCEETGGQDGSTISACIKAFCTEFTSLSGHPIMIYCSTSFGNSFFTSDLATYPLWIADWGVSSPSIPSIFNNYVLWQYTDSGSVSGISGNVDMDKINGNILL